MSENIKPSEVSEVLLQQLKGIDTHLQFDEVGNVLQVSDGVARIYGLRNAEANELLEFENGIMAIVMNWFIWEEMPLISASSPSSLAQMGNIFMMEDCPVVTPTKYMVGRLAGSGSLIMVRRILS